MRFLNFIKHWFSSRAHLVTTLYNYEKMIGDLTPIYRETETLFHENLDFIEKIESQNILLRALGQEVACADE